MPLQIKLSYRVQGFYFPCPVSILEDLLPGFQQGFQQEHHPSVNLLKWSSSGWISGAKCSLLWCFCTTFPRNHLCFQRCDHFLWFCVVEVWALVATQFFFCLFQTNWKHQKHHFPCARGKTPSVRAANVRAFMDWMQVASLLYLAPENTTRETDPHKNVMLVPIP